MSMSKLVNKTWSLGRVMGFVKSQAPGSSTMMEGVAATHRPLVNDAELVWYSDSCD